MATTTESDDNKANTAEESPSAEKPKKRGTSEQPSGSVKTEKSAVKETETEKATERSVEKTITDVPQPPEVEIAMDESEEPQAVGTGQSPRSHGPILEIKVQGVKSAELEIRKLQSKLRRQRLLMKQRLLKWENELKGREQRLDMWEAHLKAEERQLTERKKALEVMREELMDEMKKGVNERNEMDVQLSDAKSGLITGAAPRPAVTHTLAPVEADATRISTNEAKLLSQIEQGNRELRAMEDKLSEMSELLTLADEQGEDIETLISKPDSDEFDVENDEKALSGISAGKPSPKQKMLRERHKRLKLNIKRINQRMKTKNDLLSKREKKLRKREEELERYFEKIACEGEKLEKYITKLGLSSERD